jgi:hypothetical protein
MVSKSARYLWLTARAKTGSKNVGYVSAFLLGNDGKIIKPMFRVETTTTGGWANAISPASWSDEYAAMADHPNAYVQVWKMSAPMVREVCSLWNTCCCALQLFGPFGSVVRGSLMALPGLRLKDFEFPIGFLPRNNTSLSALLSIPRAGEEECEEKRSGKYQTQLDWTVDNLYAK